VANSVKEEIMSIYSEYGGIDILIKLTGLKYKVIKTMWQQYRRDPDIFKTNRPMAARKLGRNIIQHLQPESSN
jgi:hypothetical protein